MTHLQLIEMLYRHKDEIHQAYMHKGALSGTDALVKSTLFIKVADAYQLNQTYITFVDSILDRVDYGVVFEDYEKENAKLILLRKKYLKHKNPYYKEQISKLIDAVYLRFFHRDNHIRLLLKKLEHDVSLEIEIIIEEANTILHDISELIDANDKIYKTFVELKALDGDIKSRIAKMEIDFFRFSNNIENYISQLQRFIIQTKEKRRQNRLFMQVANDILNEKDTKLDEYLLADTSTKCYTIEYTKRKKVKSLPSFYDTALLKKALKSLELTKSKRATANSKLQEMPPQKLPMIDIDVIIARLDEGEPHDIYTFLKEQKDLFMQEDEVFRTYLHLLSCANISYREAFNVDGIRCVTWKGRGS
jgi:hypothetical protein